MDHIAVKIRLAEIIIFISDEQQKHVTEWYHLKLLQDLQCTIEDADDMKLLSDLHGIIYSMIAYIDYHSTVFKMVTDFAYSIEKLIALNHVLSIVLHKG